MSEGKCSLEDSNKEDRTAVGCKMSLWDQAQYWAWSDSDLKPVQLGLGPACSQRPSVAPGTHTTDVQAFLALIHIYLSCLGSKTGTEKLLLLWLLSLCKWSLPISGVVVFPSLMEIKVILLSVLAKIVSYFHQLISINLIKSRGAGLPTFIPISFGSPPFCLLSLIALRQLNTPARGTSRWQLFTLMSNLHRLKVKMTEILPLLNFHAMPFSWQSWTTWLRVTL